MRSVLRYLLVIGLILTAALLAGGERAVACQYNVRDVAFVDLGDSPYRLFVFSKGEATKSLSESLEHSQNRLVESNIEAELVDLDSNAEHLAVAYLETAKVTTFPAAVLVSPDNRTLRLDDSDKPLQADELDGLVQAIVESAVRKDIMARVLDVHSVMIVVEGDADAPNAETTKMAQEFIPRVEGILDVLPKPIDHPPHLIVLTREQAAKEKILLWSLDVDLQDESITQVAVLFGRGRRLGPVLRFPGDDERKFERSLAAVGQDCECGLDRSWMQGGMIPHVWSTETEKIALAKLKFDPGSPEVKTEIAQLLSRGPGGKSAVAESEVIFPALGYQEIELDVVSESSSAASPEASESVDASEKTAVADANDAKSETTQLASRLPAASSVESGTSTASSESVASNAGASSELATSDDKAASESQLPVTAKALSVTVTEEEGSSGSRWIYSVVIGLVVFVLVVGASLLFTGRREN